MTHGRHISIWFFVGVLLTIYGVIILGAGIADLISPSPTNVVLAELHVGIWWGTLLLILGGVYTYFFRPSRTNS